MDHHHESENKELAAQLRKHAYALEDDGFEPLIERIGDARLVLLGEASHGTSQFYTARTHLSKRLIREKGFGFIGVEGDWPDCHRVDDFIKGRIAGEPEGAQILRAFERWPTWMWANVEVVLLCEWLREHNRALGAPAQVGFFGLDVYSLWDSMATVLAYLEERDPQALQAARLAAACFEPYGFDDQAYARATAIVGASCEDEVVELMVRLRERSTRLSEEARERFDLEQNAQVMLNAERYYRTMVRGGPHAWNIRDHHMMETLDRLLERHGPDSKAIVWAHNTHIGDARATDMAGYGMFNLGQLARERYGDDAVALVGFGSHHGSVIAGRAWGAPMERMTTPPAASGSWEEAFHLAGEHDWLLITDDLAQSELARKVRGHRAIGVVYQPVADRLHNYVSTVLTSRYDGFVFFDQGDALHPLHTRPAHKGGLDTYPWGV
ncbi:MAG: erythromycin esterase family protein [Bradymonadaceae bacterium]|nr:erythromycin esterase family protein [Lujinxingiaceae bacterium]